MRRRALWALPAVTILLASCSGNAGEAIKSAASGIGSSVSVSVPVGTPSLSPRPTRTPEQSVTESPSVEKPTPSATPTATEKPSPTKEPSPTTQPSATEQPSPTTIAPTQTAEPSPVASASVPAGTASTSTSTAWLWLLLALALLAVVVFFVIRARRSPLAAWRAKATDAAASGTSLFQRLAAELATASVQGPPADRFAESTRQVDLLAGRLAELAAVPGEAAAASPLADLREALDGLRSSMGAFQALHVSPEDAVRRAQQSLALFETALERFRGSIEPPVSPTESSSGF